MKIYLDNCCFNRPYDDQSQLRVRLETEAKLKIQENIRLGLYELVWSYILDYENSKNIFRERREQIAKWQSYSEIDLDEDKGIIDIASGLCKLGIRNMDSLHIACALRANADYFLTTDDGILKKARMVKGIRVTDPIGFIKEVLL